MVDIIRVWVSPDSAAGDLTGSGHRYKGTRDNEILLPSEAKKVFEKYVLLAEDRTGKIERRQALKDVLEIEDKSRHKAIELNIGATTKKECDITLTTENEPRLKDRSYEVLKGRINRHDVELLRIRDVLDDGYENYLHGYRGKIDNEQIHPDDAEEIFKKYESRTKK